jgi:tetratricopeptide (TPR) repeat protein
MKHQQKFWFYLVCIALVSCAGDGVEYEENYTHSDNVVDKPDSTFNSIQQAQYHFEIGLKMAHLDKDTVGDWEGAIKELDEAIGLNPDFQKAYHYRSILYSYLRHDSQAMEDIQRALELDDKAVESYFVRAGLFANQGDYNKSVKDLDTIISLEPNNGKAYDHRGYAKIELGNKNEGCIDLNKARELGFMVGNREGDKLICK